jgi:restriction endonuclease S subunit
MRVADLSKNGLSEPQKYISDYFVKENQDKINDLKPKKGTILFSKDGSVGIAYHLRQNYNGITSGAILHLNVKDEQRILPEYLTLALNSKVVQMQAERDAGGSIILHWRVGEIENVVVPIIDFDKQREIADLIEQSFSLKKQSEHLLEVAKKAVEIAIEENEKVALNYIKTRDQ